MIEHKKDPDVIFPVRLKRDLFEKVKVAATREDLKAAQFIRRSIRQAIESERRRERGKDNRKNA